jgi:hypothetical protein
MMVNAIAMTAADLSASAKPWEVQAETVKGIFEEFYDQGDAEKARGLTPMAMMDRTQTDQQANSQVLKISRAFVDQVPFTVFLFIFTAWIPQRHLHSLLLAPPPAHP